MTPIEVVYKEHGYNGVVDFISKHSHIAANQVLSTAAAANDRLTVELLLPYADPKYDHSLALRRAVRNGHYDMVKFLIPISDPKAMKCSALMVAVDTRDLKMVELLLPHSDPKMRRSEFLQRCIYHDLKDIAQLLWPLSNIEVIRRDFIKEDYDHAHLQLQKMDMWEPEFQKIRLHKEIQSLGAHRSGKKSKM